MDTVRYILGIFIVVALPPGMLWWFVVHPVAGFGRRPGAKLTMAAMGVFMVASLWVLFSAREVIMGSDTWRWR